MAELTAIGHIVGSFVSAVQQLRRRDTPEVIGVETEALDDRLTHSRRLFADDPPKLLQRRLLLALPEG